MCPTMFMHASDDSAVPFNHVRELYNHAEYPKEMDIVEDADGNFTDDKHREYLLEAVADWFKRTL